MFGGTVKLIRWAVLVVIAGMAFVLSVSPAAAAWPGQGGTVSVA